MHCTYFKIFKLFTLLLSLFTSLSLCKETRRSKKRRTETFGCYAFPPRPWHWHSNSARGEHGNLWVPQDSINTNSGWLCQSLPEIVGNALQKMNQRTLTESHCVHNQDSPPISAPVLPLGTTWWRICADQSVSIQCGEICHELLMISHYNDYISMDPNHPNYLQAIFPMSSMQDGRWTNWSLSIHRLHCVTCVNQDIHSLIFLPEANAS